MHFNGPSALVFDQITVGYVVSIRRSEQR